MLTPNHGDEIIIDTHRIDKYENMFTNWLQKLDFPIFPWLQELYVTHTQVTTLWVKASRLQGAKWAKFRLEHAGFIR